MSERDATIAKYEECLVSLVCLMVAMQASHAGKEGADEMMFDALMGYTRAWSSTVQQLLGNKVGPDALAVYLDVPVEERARIHDEAILGANNRILLLREAFSGLLNQAHDHLPESEFAGARLILMMTEPQTGKISVERTG